MNICHNPLYICISYIYAHHNPAFGGISVYLKRTIYKRDGCHLANRQLHSLICSYKELVQIKVLNLCVVQTEHKVESAFILKDHSCTLSGISRTDNLVKLRYVYSVSGNLVSIVIYNQLRKAHSLLHNDIGSSGYLLYICGSLLRTGKELLCILAIQLNGNICLGTRHQLIKTQLNRLTEIKLCILYLI